MMRRIFFTLFFAMFALPLAANAAEAVNQSKPGVAIKGYDLVAYFSEGRAVKGSPKFSALYDGTTYWFASAPHRDQFLAAPRRYLPQYGGYCAYGVAQGGKFDIDPTAFAVVEGKLYLNLDHDVQKLWRKDVPGFIQKADQQWPSLAKS
jgi:YHS domain-containing protein